MKSKERMFSVALIGADGAGKTTVARRLERTLPVPARYVYMGINLESSNVMLPTTRLIVEIKRALGRRPDLAAGPPDPDARPSQPKGPARRLLRSAIGSVRMMNQMGEEWFRQWLAWRYQREGCIVLFDRHFFSDYYAHDVADNGREKSLARRLHGYMLRRVYPQPDLVIFLDAPAEVLFARKGEGTIATLERRRQEYLAMRELVPRFEVVDASQSEDAVLEEAANRIMAFRRSRTHPAMEKLGATGE